METARLDDFDLVKQRPGAWPCVDDPALLAQILMSPRQYGSIAFVSTLAMLTLVAAVPAAAQTDEDAQLWTAVTVTGKLSDTLVYSADGQFRLLDGLSRYGHTVLRGSIGVKVRPDLTVSLGYAHSTANRTGKVWVSEERVFEQFTWKIIARPGFNLT